MRSSFGRSLGLAFALCPAVLIAAGENREPAVVAVGEDHFAAGAVVEPGEPIGGDALLAGGLVECNVSVGGDATIAGGRVLVGATVGDDLYAAGGQVEVDALVAGNARIAAGRVRIAPESRIEGSAAIAGGNVEVGGRIGRNLVVAAGEVTLGGDVIGDVHVYAEQLTVLPGTRIGGRLSYRTTQPVTLPPDAQVQGGFPPGDRLPGAAQEETGDGGDTVERIGWLWLAGLAALGWLLATGLARFSARTTQAIGERPWFSIGIGLLVLASVPALVLALILTLIGIPLALITLLVYLAVLIGAYVIGALYLGDRLLAVAQPAAAITAGRRVAALLVVLLALALLGTLPVLGGAARLAVLLLGLGGIVLASWRGLRAGTPAVLPPSS